MTDRAGASPEDLGTLLFGVRPRLYRFCARMVGSAIDGEDIAQEAILKALEAFPHQGEVRNLEAWVFRIARNTALDHLRKRSRVPMVEITDDEDYADPFMDSERGLLAAASLRQFMRLPPSQRAPVILVDVIGYTLEEVMDVLQITLPAVKASLHRGRNRLRSFTHEPATQPVGNLSKGERERLENYVERFRACRPIGAT